MSESLDQQLLLILNSLAGRDIVIWKIANNALLRGSPIFFVLVTWWFASECNARRSRMLAGLFAVCATTVLSVWMQFHFKVHIRPILDPELPLKIADPIWTTFWDHTGSFPSDTATLFFGFSTVVLLENRLLGSLCFLWVTTVIAIPRIIFGWHYPSDVIGSALLALSCVSILSQTQYLPLLFDRVLAMFEGRMYFVHAFLFVFLADAFNLFASLQAIGKYFAKTLHS